MDALSPDSNTKDASSSLRVSLELSLDQIK
jgi:hypothetical protein